MTTNKKSFAQLSSCTKLFFYKFFFSLHILTLLLIPSTNIVRYLSNGSVAMEKTTKSMMHFADMSEMANNSGNTILLTRNPATDPHQMQTRSALNGLHILKRIINPTIASSMVAAVEMSEE